MLDSRRAASSRYLTRAGDKGAITAEFAIDLARGLARGEGPDWVTLRLASISGATFEQTVENLLSCVRVINPIGQSAKACAIYGS